MAQSCGFAIQVQRNFAGGMALVASQRGPEIVNVLPSRVRRDPRGIPHRGNGSAGGRRLTINVYGDVNDAEAFYRKVNEARQEFERRGN